MRETVVSAAIILTLTACSSNETSEPINTVPSEMAEKTSNISTILTAKSSSIKVYTSPTGTESKTITAPRSNAPLVFLSVGSGYGRWHALLPTPPNGSTGWISPGDVTPKNTSYRVQVNTRDHTLFVYKGDKMIVKARAGIGKSDTPTPGGRYYLTVLLKAPNPDGVYGPFAYGISGRSPKLQSFNGKDPIIGIHGTNQPKLLGKSVSHGCIRVSNKVITYLAMILPLGTPVRIT
jgi:lipoprotein-anchoring transpeptidase ErfK/SrfK